MDKLIGVRLDGRYLVEQLIGEGGMADVYRGEDLLDHHPVAIKILREEHNHNEELVRRFTNESRAISVLNHPNIVKVFDVSVDERLHYIVMELISGITLKEYIEQRGEPLTYKEVVHFTSQVLYALQHAHDKGIIHRDIKPQNIMILEDGSIKMMDFGIARLARSEIHTAEEQAIGSVHYISPEQAQGIDTDLRADIYSVGIMMYEMLSGQLPFEDDNAVAIAVKQISDEAVPLQKVNPSVPQGLAEVAMRAMNKNPRHRYQSALEMLRDIEEFKRNPSIKFEYDYLSGDEPARHVGKAMGNSAYGRNSAGTKARKSSHRERKRRRKKIGLLVPIFLGLTIAMLGICSLYAWDLLQNSANPLFGEYEEIALPDVVGMQYSDVEKLCEKAPYNYLRLRPTEEENPGYPEGTVISQSPTSSENNPKMVKANQTLYLTVSSGVKTVTIPEVKGLDSHDAIKAMLAEGLMPYAKAVRADGQTVGMVLGTQPEAGTPVKNTPGFVVTILVASRIGSYERTVPNVEGVATVEEAQQILEAAGLQVGQVKELDATEPAGTVIKQYPAPGSVTTVGSEVHVYISRTPPPPVEEEPPPAPSGGGTSKPKPPSSVPDSVSSESSDPSGSESSSDVSSSTSESGSSSEEVNSSG